MAVLQESLMYLCFQQAITTYPNILSLVKSVNMLNHTSQKHSIETYSVFLQDRAGILDSVSQGHLLLQGGISLAQPGPVLLNIFFEGLLGACLLLTFSQLLIHLALQVPVPSLNTTAMTRKFLG